MRFRAKGEPLNEVEQYILDTIRRFPSLYRSHIDVLSNVLLTYCGACRSPWVDGKYVDDSYERNDDETSDYYVPFVLSEEEGMRLLEYGYMDHVTIIPLDWSTESVIYCIPDDCDEMWLDAIQDFMTYFVKIPDVDYKIHLMSNALLHYSRQSTGWTEHLPRRISAWVNLMDGFDEIAKKHGWDWLIRANYHAPKTHDAHKERMKQVLDDTVDEVDRQIDIITLTSHQ